MATMICSTPQVQAGILRWRPAAGSRPSPIAVGTAAWYAWLDAHQAFALTCHDIRVTARKERRAGGFYWYAYRRQHGTLRSAYLGKSEDLTLGRLTAVAQRLATPPHRQRTMLVARARQIAQHCCAWMIRRC